jgi:AbiTii
MSLFDEIQDDIIGNEDLSVILRKAKVLAYKLKNKEFKDWIENELTGYAGKPLPEYRKLPAFPRGQFIINTTGQIDDAPILLNNIENNLHSYFQKCRFRHGIKELESLSNEGSNSLIVFLPTEILSSLSEGRIYTDAECLNAWLVVAKSSVKQILDTTRNNLLNFILELADKYPEIKEIKSNTDLTRRIPNDQITHVFNNCIFGDRNNIGSSGEQIILGDNMTVFDQRGQNVQTQYNAAGDINFSSVQNSVEFVAELRKLKDEFSKVAKEEAIDAEVVTDTEYQLTKAIQQAEKAQPDKGIISNHLEKAKQLVGSLDTSIKIVKTVGPYISMAIEHLDKIFG